MRLFLLPVSTKRTLIYCKRLNQQLNSQTTYVEKVTNRASNVWRKWENTDGGWQRKLTVWGNQLFQRIPYEEWGLKSIPPLSARRPAKDVEGQEETEVIYPSLIIEPGKVFDVLQKLATERQALHRKWMIGSIIGMPLTIPFALSGSKHIEALLKNGFIKSTPSQSLNRAYASEILRPAKSNGPVWYEFRNRLTGETLLEPLLKQNKPSASQVQKVIDAIRQEDAHIRFLSKVVREVQDTLPGDRQVDDQSIRLAETNSKAQSDLERSCRNMAASVNQTLVKTGHEPVECPRSGTPLDDMAEIMLLRSDSAVPIVGSIGEHLEENVPDLVNELNRAIQQVTNSLSAKEELEDEKQKLDSATKDTSEKDALK